MTEGATAWAPEIRPEEAELLRRLRQFIGARWLAVAGILASVALAQTVFDIRFALAPVLATSAGVALCNLAFWLWARSDERLVRHSRALTNAQVVTDLLGLTILLHFTGGIENPFFVFYFFHVGFGIILLESRDIYWVTALAIGLFVALVGAEYAGWLPHVHLEGFLPGELYRKPAYVVAILIAFATTLSLVSAVAARMMAELRRRREEHAQAKARELEQVRQKLDELDRMRTFFLALASHDLKTPLAAAVNFIQTILDGYSGEVNPKQRRWLERSAVRLEEMLQLINDFLDVSQLDEARIAQELEPTCLASIADQVTAELSARARERQVTIQTDIPPDLSWVLGSPKRLHRLLINLLDNGIKFTPQGGLVTLTLTEDDDLVRVNVTDTGPGIPASYLPHIFEDYFRIRRQEFIPGAGLGLSTARRIVEAHSGKIWVESPYRPDQPGSRFTFCLQKAARVDVDTRSHRRDAEGAEGNILSPRPPPGIGAAEPGASVRLGDAKDQSMAITIERLRRSDIFHELTDDELAQMAQFGHEATYNENDVVLAEDAPAERLFIVEQGKLSLEKKIQMGRRGTVRTATIGVVGPGKSAGWSALTPPNVYTSTAVCLEPARVIDLDAAQLRSFLNDNPRVGYKVMTVIAGLARARYKSATDTLAYFVSLVSHELRAPLAAIENYLNVMLEGFAGDLGDKQRRMLQRSVLRVNDLRSLIGDIVDLARMRPEQIQADFEWFDPAEVGTESIEDVRLAAGEKNVRIKIEPPPEFVKIVGARRRMRQVFTNLLTNAIKFSPPGSTVTFRARYEPDALTFEVEDEGIGIPPDDLPHIFDDFYRAENVGDVSGAGLGLSIARKVMDAHHGQILVQSPYTEGKTGTRFTVIIPRNLETPEMRRGAHAAGSDTSGDKA